jgi:hypothetical protein
LALAWPGLDWVVCYQSRVGPLAWIGPATDAEIRRAGAGGVPLVVAPISFVSEHSETLVELDLEYRRAVGHRARMCDWQSRRESRRRAGENLARYGKIAETADIPGVGGFFL